MRKKKKQSQFGNTDCYPIPAVDRCTFDLVVGVATGRIKIQPDKISLNEAWKALENLAFQLEKMDFIVKDVMFKELIHHVADNAAGYVGLKKEEAIAGMLTQLYTTMRKRCLDLAVAVFYDDSLLTWEECEEENLK